MNVIETTVPALENIKKNVFDNTNRINKILQELKLQTINVNDVTEVIDKQIESANDKFTIAFLGTFKTGKSTIINSLLELKGEQKLSSEFDPDTAKCIRIKKKEKGQEYDAEIVFKDGKYPTKKTSWEDAKRYTSQVYLNEAGESFNNDARAIDEVRYYIDHVFLDVCDILDLPGTGTGDHSEHDMVTDSKILKADCIFWVISTDTEPDRESIRNLGKISTKMLPIINVWQCEAEGTRSQFSPEEIKEQLYEKFGAYFSDAEDAIKYYAKEIDRAQEYGYELQAGWGKVEFFDKVQSILDNAQKSDRMDRIRRNIRDALDDLAAVLNDLKARDDIDVAYKKIKKDCRDDRELAIKLNKCKMNVHSEIQREAEARAEEIIGVLISASDAFISNRMSGINFKALRRKSFQEELKKDFENNYVKLKSGWVEKCTEGFASNVKSILLGDYSEFSFDISNDVSFAEMDNGIDDISGFINSMVESMGADIRNKLLPIIISLIAGGILMAIPGGIIAEALATVVASGGFALKNFSNDDRLVKKQESAKVQSRCAMRQQKIVLKNNLYNMGNEFNEQCSKEIEEKMSRIRDQNDLRYSKLNDLHYQINAFQNALAECQKDVVKL